MTFSKIQTYDAYVFIGYDFIGLIFINDISIQTEATNQRCSTLLHWIARHSLTIIYCSIRLYIFKSELTDCLCLLTKIYALKTKTFIPVLAYFDPCFWSKTLKNKPESKNTSAEQLHCKTLLVEILLKTSWWLLLDTV